MNPRVFVQLLYTVFTWNTGTHAHTFTRYKRTENMGHLNRKLDFSVKRRGGGGSTRLNSREHCKWSLNKFVFRTSRTSGRFGCGNVRTKISKKKKKNTDLYVH